MTAALLKTCCLSLSSMKVFCSFCPSKQLRKLPIEEFCVTSKDEMICGTENTSTVVGSQERNKTSQETRKILIPSNSRIMLAQDISLFAQVFQWTAEHLPRLLLLGK